MASRVMFCVGILDEESEERMSITMFFIRSFFKMMAIVEMEAQRNRYEQLEDNALCPAISEQKALVKDFFRQNVHLKDSGVLAYRNAVLKKGPFIDDSVAPDLPKSDRKAAEACEAGDRLYQQNDYPAALEKYNESICWAEGSGSERLGIGYGKRSAVYYDMGEYEICLVNIDLAKKHNYPQRLMSDLIARELKCKNQIANGHSKRAKPCYKFAKNVKAHPMRPFMAAGIVQKVLPGYGRSMVAERAFKPGDAILKEKAMLAAVSSELKYKNCNFCSIENFHSLIPCPNCVSVMYCSQECLEKDLKFSHRFECGISEKLQYLSPGGSHLHMGAKAFFYGLTLFDDNLKDMMTFCKANGRTGGDPFTLDYTNYDPLEEFKIFHTIKLPVEEGNFECLFNLYAALYYSIYVNHPVVQSIVTTKEQKNFMLHSFLDYMRTMTILVIKSRLSLNSHFYSIASVCNHSCDPNTVVVDHCGELRFIVVRPIAEGEQIFISYGPQAREHSEYERQKMLRSYQFDCTCDSCDDREMQRLRAAAAKLPELPQKQFMAVNSLLEDPNADEVELLKMLQRVVKRNAYAYPRYDYVRLLDNYRRSLERAFVAERQDALRAKASNEV